MEEAGIHEITVTSTAVMKRDREEWELERKQMWNRRKAAEDDLESRVGNPCAGCIKADKCVDFDTMQKWREEQKTELRIHKTDRISRICGDRYPVMGGFAMYDLREGEDDGRVDGQAGTDTV